MNGFGGGRRGVALMLAVLVANAWLVAIVIDAVVGLVDDLLIHSANDSALFAARTSWTIVVLALTVVALLLVIFVPHLPKRVLVPPLVIQLWLLLGAMPLEWSIDDRASLVPLGLIQLAGALAAFVMSKLTTGRWFITASQLPYKRFSIVRTLIAIPVSLIVLAVLGIGVLIGAVVVYIEDQTKGYVQFASSGIEARHTVMRKGDKVVHLVGTVHFAEARFYRELYAAIPRDALILAEGVTDREGRLRKGLSYSNAAQALGLETQGVFEELIGPAQEPAAAPSEAVGPDASAAPGERQSSALSATNDDRRERPTVVRADIDVSEFSELTIRFVSRVGEIYASRTLDEAIQKISEITTEFSDKEIALVMDDLVRKRNDKVLAEFDKRLATFGTVFVPWGALHMPGLEAGLKERGFAIERQTMTTVVRYGTILGALRGRSDKAVDARMLLPAAAVRLARPRGVEPLLQD